MGRGSIVPSAFALLVAACSSSSSTSAPADAGKDAAPPVVNDCTDFVDRTAPDANRVLTWDRTISADPSRCIHIKVGQTVTFSDGFGNPGDFAMHPLLAFNGDTPNPIQDHLDQQTGNVTFDAPGTFGFLCSTHFDMHGAVLVTP